MYRPMRKFQGTLLSFFCAIITVTLSVTCSREVTAPPRAISMLSPDTPVTVTGGQIRGALSDTSSEVVAFKGIPYAAPPLGDLRWRPPQPVIAWDGIRDATATRPGCLQAGDAGEPLSEDCLFLNVWAPRETVEPLPVMVWIHGGGYRLGSSSRWTYDGAPLSSTGVVLVTINYRLNVFGFFAHPALSGESEHGASGNYGLMDMVSALEWVRSNIATFGGDPDRVTIFGESAGGGSVMSLMIVPQAGDLFHRAIAQSTYVPGWDRALRSPARGWESAEAQGLRVADAVGAVGDNPLTTMRALPADELLEAADVGAGNVIARAGNVWAPNVDGWFIPEDPLLMYRAGRQHRVPLIAGMTGNEGSVFRSRTGVESVDDFELYVSTHYEAVAPDLQKHYDVTSNDAVTRGVDHLLHDMIFAGPVRVQLRAQARVMAPAWLYEFAQVPPTPMGERFGAHHAGELSYVFGLATRAADHAGEGTSPPPVDGAWSDADRRLSATMMAYWTRFAATGDPNRDGLPDWPAFDLNTDQYVTLADPIVVGTGLHREGAHLFDQFEAARRAEH